MQINSRIAALNGAVAHRSEQRAYISLAVGSIPTRPTTVTSVTRDTRATA